MDFIDNVGSVENDQDLLSLLASVQPTPSAQTFCFGSKKAETSSEQDRKSMVSNTVETTEAPIAVPVIRRDSIPSLEDIMNCYKSELKEFENIVAAIEEGISENPPPELAQHINNEFKMMFNTITELHNEGIQSLKSRYPAACDNVSSCNLELVVIVHGSPWSNWTSKCWSVMPNRFW